MDFGKDLWLIPKQSNSWLQTDAETESQGYIAEPCSAYIAKAALKPARRALQDLAHSRPFCYWCCQWSTWGSFWAGSQPTQRATPLGQSFALGGLWVMFPHVYSPGALTSTRATVCAWELVGSVASHLQGLGSALGSWTCCLTPLEWSPLSTLLSTWNHSSSMSPALQCL